MRVSVFGLGYVGCVTAACLARQGHDVIGVDIDARKLETLGAGRSPIIEPGMDELIAQAIGSGRLQVTSDASVAVEGSEVSLVCVGTPSLDNGNLDLNSVEKVCQEIAGALAAKSAYHVVVIRSTVLPGTLRDRILPLLEQLSGKSAGTDFGLATNPEFLRETKAIEDFYNPSFTLVGALDERSGDAVERIYDTIEVPTIRTSIEAAEMVKYANNAFHALKVSFANEIGNLAKAHGVDGRDVMEILCRDTRLNLSRAYLRPGFAFGGSCLPKDTRALVYRAKERDIAAPLLASVLESNDHHIRRGIEMVERTGRKKVGVLGLSFKAGTDDVRESPAVPLIETLVGRGYELLVYDEQVELSRLIGTNKAFLEEEIPHIASLLRANLEDVIGECEVLVVANGSPEFNRVPQLMADDQVLVDLVGIGATDGLRAGYEGICW